MGEIDGATKKRLSIALGLCWADALVCYISPEIGILCCNFALRTVVPWMNTRTFSHFFLARWYGCYWASKLWLDLFHLKLFVIHVSRAHNKQCMQHPAFPTFFLVDFVGGFRILWYSSPAPDSVLTPVLYAQKQYRTNPNVVRVPCPSMVRHPLHFSPCHQASQDGSKMIFIQFFQKWPILCAHNSPVFARHWFREVERCAQCIANKISQGQKRPVSQFYADCDWCPRVRLCDAFPWTK